MAMLRRSSHSAVARRRGKPCLLLQFTQLAAWTAATWIGANIALAADPIVAAIPALLDNMDGDAPVLRPRDATAAMTIHAQRIDRNLFRYGSGAERVELSCPAGRLGQLAYGVPGVPVIGELRLVAQVQCSRPGVQLAASVVLPRATNRSTGQPHQLLVRGSVVERDGPWQRLVLADVPTALARQARIARAQYGTSIDERGAYVTQLVLLVPGGPGLSDLVVDRVEVYGAVDDRDHKLTTDPNVVAAAAAGDSPRGSATLSAFRTIEWQGEPLELLAKLGFDAVRIGRPPTVAEAEEAGRLGLSIVCPPPTPNQITADGIRSTLSQVAVWELGDQLADVDLDHVLRWKQLIRRHDPVAHRPTLLSSQRFTREASRIADVVLLDRPLLGSNLTLHEYAAWLTQRQRLTRPGTPLWAKIESQLSPQQSAQLAALHPTTANDAGASYTQLAAITSATFAVQPRGFYFGSHSSLAGDDLVTRRRGQALQLINLRLGLVQPWLSQGKLMVSARSSQAGLTALVLQAERSHLLVPIHWSDSVQSNSSSRDAGPVWFVVPGVAESSEAYLLTLGGPQRLRHRRVTGGIRVEVDSLPADGLLLLTDDARAFSQVARYLRRHAPQSVQLRRDLAAFRLQESIRAGKSSTNPRIAEARQTLQACDQALANRDFEVAYGHADAVEQSLADQSVAQLQLERALARAPAGANRLVGGGFEDLSSLLESGWRHRQLPSEGITTAVRLSPTAPHSGSYCLQLEARPIDADGPAPVVPNAPVWITSAPVRVRAGELVEITGVARVPLELIGSIDGLQIIDSLGGLTMAVRITHAPSWQPFRLIRAATIDADVSVTLALSGLGTAQVDDLAIRTVRLPNVNTVEAATRPTVGRSVGR